MSIGKKLEAVADNLRDVYGKGTAVGYSQGYAQGYTDGAQEGGIQARAYCLTRHYADSVFGNGENELRIAIPFQPDLVTVNTCHPYSSEIPNCIKGFTVDLRGCGRHMGNVITCTENGTVKSTLIIANPANNFFKYENGEFYACFNVSAYPNIRWMPNVRYNVMAVRYSDENSKDLITEQIQLLPNDPPAGSSGTLTYSEAIIDTHFTQSEWKFLISRKPNWNFVLK